MTYAMKPLACDPKRIKGMSEQLIVSHYENNYGGAVNRLNAITAQLAELDFAKAPGFVIKREELIASNSMILHELFFASLADETAPEGEFRDALARDFGSFDRWRAEFSAMGKAQGGGSGWVLLTWSPRDRKLVNQWAMDHTTTLAGATPILALDMYEHSYHMDYGARAAAYVHAFMAAINWPNVARAYRELRPWAYTPDRTSGPLSCDRDRSSRRSLGCARWQLPRRKSPTGRLRRGHHNDTTTRVGQSLNEPPKTNLRRHRFERPECVAKILR